MTATLERIEQDAMRLPENERAFLADRLLASLGGETGCEVETAWVIEAEKRYQEYRQGKRQPIPAATVFAEADQ
jgi:putative addiction module component (TIGR02574 family)